VTAGLSKQHSEVLTAVSTWPLSPSRLGTTAERKLRHAEFRYAALPNVAGTGRDECYRPHILTRRSMALPFHISKKLRQHLGDDTGGDLVNWLAEMRAERELFRDDVLASEARLVARMGRGSPESMNDSRKWTSDSRRSMSDWQASRSRSPTPRLS